MFGIAAVRQMLRLLTTSFSDLHIRERSKTTQLEVGYDNYMRPPPFAFITVVDLV